MVEDDRWWRMVSPSIILLLCGKVSIRVDNIHPSPTRQFSLIKDPSEWDHST